MHIPLFLWAIYLSLNLLIFVFSSIQKQVDQYLPL